VKVWRAEKPMEYAVLRDEIRKVGAAAVAFQNKNLILGRSSLRYDSPEKKWVSGSVSWQQWDPNTGQLLPSHNLPTDRVDALALTPDGRTQAWLAMDKEANSHVLYVRGPKAAEARKFPLVQLPGGNGRINLALAPDGSRAATINGNGLVTMWDLIQDKKDESFDAISVPGGPLRFSPNGDFLAVAAGNNQVDVWNLAKAPQQKPQKIQANHPVNCLAFHADGSTLAIGGFKDPGGIISVWHLKSAEKWAEFTGGHLSNVASLAFAPEGRILVSGGGHHPKGPIEATSFETRMTGELILWDLNSKKKLTTLPGHEGSVLSLGFSSPGRLLATCGSEGTVRIWDMEANSGK